MFGITGRKVEVRLVKTNSQEGPVDTTPSITKEDVIHVTKNVVKFVAAAVLIGMASKAVLETAQYSAMSRTDHKYATKELED